MIGSGYVWSNVRTNGSSVKSLLVSENAEKGKIMTHYFIYIIVWAGSERGRVRPQNSNHDPHSVTWMIESIYLCGPHSFKCGRTFVNMFLVTSLQVLSCGRKIGSALLR